MPRPERPYDSTYWRKLRKLVLARDGYKCQLRFSERCKGKATTVHHKEDWRSGGAWYDLDNLEAACWSCNTAERNSRIARKARGETLAPGPSSLFTGMGTAHLPPAPPPSRDW